eukprot:jgi/Bigna1/83693/fgenesh1_pg.113_\
MRGVSVTPSSPSPSLFVSDESVDSRGLVKNTPLPINSSETRDDNGTGLHRSQVFPVTPMSSLSSKICPDQGQLCESLTSPANSLPESLTPSSVAGFDGLPLELANKVIASQESRSSRGCATSVFEEENCKTDLSEIAFDTQECIHKDNNTSGSSNNRVLYHTRHKNKTRRDMQTSENREMLPSASRVLPFKSADVNVSVTSNVEPVTDARTKSYNGIERLDTQPFKVLESQIEDSKPYSCVQIVKTGDYSLNVSEEALKRPENMGTCSAPGCENRAECFVATPDHEGPQDKKGGREGANNRAQQQLHPKLYPDFLPCCFLTRCSKAIRKHCRKMLKKAIKAKKRKRKKSDVDTSSSSSPPSLPFEALTVLLLCRGQLPPPPNDLVVESSTSSSISLQDNSRRCVTIHGDWWKEKICGQMGGELLIASSLASAVKHVENHVRKRTRGKRHRAAKTLKPMVVGVVCSPRRRLVSSLDSTVAISWLLDCLRAGKRLRFLSCYAYRGRQSAPLNNAGDDGDYGHAENRKTHNDSEDDADKGKKEKRGLQPQSQPVNDTIDDIIHSRSSPLSPIASPNERKVMSTEMLNINYAMFNGGSSKFRLGGSRCWCLLPPTRSRPSSIQK